MAVETSVIPKLLRECLKDSKVVYFKGSDLGRPNEISSKNKFMCQKLYLVCTEWKDVSECEQLRTESLHQGAAWYLG